MSNQLQGQNNSYFSYIISVIILTCILIIVWFKKQSDLQVNNKNTNKNIFQQELIVHLNRLIEGFQDSRLNMLIYYSIYKQLIYLRQKIYYGTNISSVLQLLKDKAQQRLLNNTDNLSFEQIKLQKLISLINIQAQQIKQNFNQILLKFDIKNPTNKCLLFLSYNVDLRMKIRQIQQISLKLIQNANNFINSGDMQNIQFLRNAILNCDKGISLAFLIRQCCIKYGIQQTYYQPNEQTNNQPNQQTDNRSIVNQPNNNTTIYQRCQKKASNRLKLIYSKLFNQSSCSNKYTQDNISHNQNYAVKLSDQFKQLLDHLGTHAYYSDQHNQQNQNNQQNQDNKQYSDNSQNNLIQSLTKQLNLIQQSKQKTLITTMRLNQHLNKQKQLNKKILIYQTNQKRSSQNNIQQSQKNKQNLDLKQNSPDSIDNQNSYELSRQTKLSFLKQLDRLMIRNKIRKQIQQRQLASLKHNQYKQINQCQQECNNQIIEQNQSYKQQENY